MTVLNPNNNDSTKTIKTFKDVLNYVRKNKINITIAAGYENAKIVHIKNRKIMLPITEEALASIIKQQKKEN